MNKELQYKIIKKIPKFIRNIGKLVYNPVIPEVSKINYGERLMPEENERYILGKIKSILNLNGDLIEFGVYRGGSIIKFAQLLKDLNINKKIYGLDTFEGSPESSKEDNVPGIYSNVMENNNIKKLRDTLKKYDVKDKIILVKGLFKNTIPKLKDKKFCFGYIDCTLYQGTKEALKFLIPRMQKGGLICVDDYESKSWIGVRKAVNEFVKKETLEIYNGQAYLRF